MIPLLGPILILGGLVHLVVPRRGAGQALLSLLLGALAVVTVALLEPGGEVRGALWGNELILGTVTPLRLVFGWAFALALALWSVYAWRLRDVVERAAGFVYGGCALGVVFSGDLLTLLLFWEGMMISSTLVVIRGKTEAASRAAYRYLMIHILGGVLLLSGIGLLLWGGDSAIVGGVDPRAFGDIPLDGIGAWLVFVGFAINAAAWPLSAWLPDAYPTASPTGTVLLGTFTTKTAVFVMITAFAGEEALLLLGAAMALYAVIYALGTRDVRRLLSYSLVGQVGFMLVAAGTGTELGVSAAAAHAFMHVLYKSLLFMSAGAVLLSTGRAVGGSFVGLWRKLPYAAAFGLVGALSISAVPLTCGYVSKALIFDSLHMSRAHFAYVAEWALIVASVAAPLYVGLRFLWLAFAGDDAAGVREARPTPWSMRLAMGLLAALCLGLGVWPAPVLALLPGEIPAGLYSASHVGKQLVFLAIGTLAFVAWRLARRRIDVRHPDPLPDTDALYIPVVNGVLSFIKGPLMVFFARLSRLAHHDVPWALGFFGRNPAGAMRLAYERLRLAAAGISGSDDAIDRAQERLAVQRGRYRRVPGGPWPIGRTVFFGALLLVVYLLLWGLT